MLLAEICQEFLPPGVLNVVTGDRDTGRALVEHPIPQLVAITGSVRAGMAGRRARRPRSSSASHLELGGKAPVIVFDDADVEAAAEAIAVAGYFNAGQDCTAATRVLAGPGVHDDFVAALTEQARNTKTGMPDDEDVLYGPLNNTNQLVARLRLRRPAARPRHARDRRPPAGRRGLLLRADGAVGPAAGRRADPDRDLRAGDHRAEVLRRGRGAALGQRRASTAWRHRCGPGTTARAMRMARGLDFGCVWINTHIPLVAEMPHGGFKHSGYGKDLSMYGLEDYTRIKHVMSYIGSSRTTAACEILLVGAGGVGAAFAAIAARRDFFEAVVVADYDAARGPRPRRRPRRTAFVAAQVDASSAESVAALCREHRITHVMNAVDPRFVMPIFDGRVRGGRRLPRHGDVAVATRTRRRRTPSAGSSWATSSSRRPATGRRPGGWRWSASASSPGLSDVFARYAADHLFSEIDELGMRDGVEPHRRGLRLRAVVLDLDDDRGVPQPAGDLGAGPRLVHDRRRSREPEVFDFPEGIGPVECVNVEHEEVLLMPRWVECRRVTFKYGLGDEFIEVLRTLHKLGLDRTDKVQVGGVEVSPRDVVAACLPEPGRARPTDERARPAPASGSPAPARTSEPTARSTYLYHVVDNEWAMEEYGHQCRGVADRDQPGRRAGAARARHLVGRRRPRSRGVRRGALPRPAHRVRLALGPAGAHPPPRLTRQKFALTPSECSR